MLQFLEIDSFLEKIKVALLVSMILYLAASSVIGLFLNTLHNLGGIAGIFAITLKWCTNKVAGALFGSIGLFLFLIFFWPEASDYMLNTLFIKTSRWQLTLHEQLTDHTLVPDAQKRTLIGAAFKGVHIPSMIIGSLLTIPGGALVSWAMNGYPVHPILKQHFRNLRKNIGV